MIDESAGFADLELNFILKDTKQFYQIMKDLKNKFHNCIKEYNYFRKQVYTDTYIPAFLELENFEFEYGDFSFEMDYVHF